MLARWAKNFTNWNCASDAASAFSASAHSASPTLVSVSPRRAGATYCFAVSTSWFSVVRSVVLSVSEAMLSSTSET